MKVVLFGGSGQLGRILRKGFESQNAEVVTVGRHASGPNRLEWDGKTLGPWADAVESADLVVNLAGKSVNCRCTEQSIKEMTDSRVLSVRAIAQAISQAKNPPKVWLQAVTAAIYLHRYDAPHDEQTGVLGGNEQGVPWQYRVGPNIAKQWEAEFQTAQTPKTRKVAMRIGVVMSPQAGGAFAIMAKLARRGMLGTAGNGRQMVSWIHSDDLFSAVDFLAFKSDLDGIVNVVGPNPVPNSEFNRAIRDALGVKLGPPSPAWLVALATKLMGTEAELVLKSRWVLPKRLQDAGFKFKFNDWPTAARDLVARLEKP